MSKPNLSLRVLSGCFALMLAGQGCDSTSEPLSTIGTEASAQPAPPVDDGRDNLAQADYDDDRDLAPTGAPPGAESAAADDYPPPASGDATVNFSAEQLEQLVAPIALYPDQLLMDVLMAATYPTEVEEAAIWKKQHPDLNGKALDDAIADKGWDVSVNALTHATQALDLMAADATWTRDLGDAFLAQQDDVLNAVQIMRVRACDNGNLKTTEQQKVIIEEAPPPAQPAQPSVEYVVAPPTRIVRIVPTFPDVVYVPVYNPRVIYGSIWEEIYYPRVFVYPAIHVGIAPIITFGVGLSIGSYLYGDVDWHHRHVYSRRWGGGYYGGDYHHRDRYSSRAERWRHDVHHRRDVSYRRPDLAQRYGGTYRAPDRTRSGDRDRYRQGERDRDLDRRRREAESRGGSVRDGSRDGRDGGRDSREGSRDSRDGGRVQGGREPERDSRDRDGGREQGGRDIDRDQRDRDSSQADRGGRGGGGSMQHDDRSRGNAGDVRGGGRPSDSPREVDRSARPTDRGQQGSDRAARPPGGDRDSGRANVGSKGGSSGSKTSKPEAGPRPSGPPPRVQTPDRGGQDRGGSPSRSGGSKSSVGGSDRGGSPSRGGPPPRTGGGSPPRMSQPDRGGRPPSHGGSPPRVQQDRGGSSSRGGGAPPPRMGGQDRSSGGGGGGRPGGSSSSGGSRGGQNKGSSKSSGKDRDGGGKH